MGAYWVSKYGKLDTILSCNVSKAETPKVLHASKQKIKTTKEEINTHKVAFLLPVIWTSLPKSKWVQLFLIS